MLAMKFAANPFLHSFLIPHRFGRCNKQEFENDKKKYRSKATPITVYTDPGVSRTCLAVAVLSTSYPAGLYDPLGLVGLAGLAGPAADTLLDPGEVAVLGCHS